MNLVAEIKSLQMKRTEHVVAIQAIDDQLAELRAVLGVEPSSNGHAAVVSRPLKKPWSGDGSQTRDRIMAALAKHEPQTTNELAAIVGSTTAAQLLSVLYHKGELARRRLGAHGKMYSYARSNDVFAPFDVAATEDAEAQAADPG